MKAHQILPILHSYRKLHLWLDTGDYEETHYYLPYLHTLLS